MSGRSFLDSNVLVYTDDASEPVKQRAAITLVSRTMRDRSGVVSLQGVEVVNPFLNLEATRKPRR